MEVPRKHVDKGRLGIERAFFDPIGATHGVEVHGTTAKKQVVDIALKVYDQLVVFSEPGIVSTSAVRESAFGQRPNLRCPGVVVVIDEHRGVPVFRRPIVGKVLCVNRYRPPR